LHDDLLREARSSDRNDRERVGHRRSSIKLSDGQTNWLQMPL
jgi:hypothetical protein